MTKLNDLYKCPVCGNIVEVVHASVGELVCCGKPMDLLKPNTTDGATEKHVPVVEKVEGGYLIKIGSAPHPMTEEHYIEFIEIMTEDAKIARKYLKPGDAPEAKFSCKPGLVHVREYCNLHGLWAAK
ncbi:MAG: desulfoferrodoxin [Elusimicrobiota bacterium]|jgi:superoxide reductase|nr:desulfoferrodoxin [Elusimicrobiota bacterium]